jgi:hypothetical protein
VAGVAGAPEVPLVAGAGAAALCEGRLVLVEPPPQAATSSANPTSAALIFEPIIACLLIASSAP